MEGYELNETQKLQLAEQAVEIYRQQLKFLQDHLASLRSLIQNKENIIENLLLRYDLGIITQDSNRQGPNLSVDEIELDVLRRKAEALAQRTIRENFELGEMVNELRDEKRLKRKAKRVWAAVKHVKWSELVVGFVCLGFGYVTYLQFVVM